MRHTNYYNQHTHKLLSQYYLLHKMINKNTFKKYPVLKQNNRHSRLLLKKRNNLKRFVYSTIKPKRDKRRL